MRRLLLLLLLPALLCGCAFPGRSGPELHTSTLLAMDTVMELRVYGGSEELLGQAEQRIRALEGLLSVTDPGSELYQLNQTGTADLSSDTAALLERALELCRETEGALDLSIYPVVRAWGFTTGVYRVPGEKELAGLLARVDYSQISLTPSGAVSLPEGMEMDLGGVAKGYTGDRVVELLREAGITSALLSLGGNVQTLGTKPDGSDWSVAIRAPEGEGYLGVLSVSDQAVVTSGGYERYFEENGKTYHHIIDPATGYPADNGLLSVTVVAKANGPDASGAGNGAMCDAFSTALFVMGEEKALDFWRTGGYDFDLVLVTADGRVVVTAGLADRFEEVKDSGYTYETVS